MIRLHDKPQTRSRTSPFIKRGPLSAQISMNAQDIAACASVSKEISAKVHVLGNFKRIGPSDWMTQRQIWPVYNVSSPIAQQSDHDSFVQWANDLYEKNKRDDVSRRVQFVELSSTKQTSAAAQETTSHCWYLTETTELAEMSPW